MEISKAMLEWFYYTLLNKTTSEYRGYTLKFIKSNKEFRLLKNNRKLASWFLLANETKTYGNEETTAEKKFIKNFTELPIAVEKLHSEIKVKRVEKEKKKQMENEQVHDSFMHDLNEYCLLLKDHEITKEALGKLIETLAYKYIDIWYVVGINPDKYEDNFPIYFGQAKSRVHSSLLAGNDDRIKKFLGNKSETNSEKRKTGKSDLTDDELKKQLNIIPVQAQREGNLVTISELENKRFQKLVNGAIRYAKSIVCKDIRKYIYTGLLTIYWWEKDGQYFLPPSVEKKVPETLRELILFQLEPKPKAAAKPSRIELEISFKTDNIGKELLPSYPQKGIIYWKAK